MVAFSKLRAWTLGNSSSSGSVCVCDGFADACAGLLSRRKKLTKRYALDAVFYRLLKYLSSFDSNAQMFAKTYTWVKAAPTASPKAPYNIINHNYLTHYLVLGNQHKQGDKKEKNRKVNRVAMPPSIRLAVVIALAEPSCLLRAALSPLGGRSHIHLHIQCPQKAFIYRYLCKSQRRFRDRNSRPTPKTRCKYLLTAPCFLWIILSLAAPTAGWHRRSNL